MSDQTPMIESVQFQNFLVLRKAELPLSRVTLLIGPNGSGKTTALTGFDAIRQPDFFRWASLISVGISEGAVPTVTVNWDDDVHNVFDWPATPGQAKQRLGPGKEIVERQRLLANNRVFAFEPRAIAEPSKLEKTLELDRTGGRLAAVLTNLQDQFPERFEELNRELRRWMPEFDRVLLDTTQRGTRAFLLRTAQGHHRIDAGKLSHGTLFAVAILTIAYLPSPPVVLGLEEPDRGIHPRLLRDVQDALFRLAYPENFGDSRRPVQVIITTHSPYLVDLFRDHREDIVIAQREGLYGSFKRLVDIPNIDEILTDAHLGEAWFSGILGGVPAGT